MLQDYVNLQRLSESAFVIESSIFFSYNRALTANVQHKARTTTIYKRLTREEKKSIARCQMCLFDVYVCVSVWLRVKSEDRRGG